jgi:hypothetical protein
VFVGKGGALTGRGMHLGLGDDLFKDHEEARSQAARDRLELVHQGLHDPAHGAKLWSS